MSLIFTMLDIQTFLVMVCPLLLSLNTHTHGMIIQNKSALNMPQLWKSLSLIHYKDLKYNVVDYAFDISSYLLLCVRGKNTCPLSQ